MIKVDWSSMIEEEKNMKNLIRANVIDIVRPSEVDRLKQEGILTSIKGLDVLVEDGTRILRKNCNE